jgi:dethiobiotin synthetase
MRVFITGTDTGIGKTLVSSWLCAHTGFDYFKPIQTGVIEGCDSDVVARDAGVFAHPEVYRYQAPVSPHWAASLEGEQIELARIQLPRNDQLVIEGAGGVMVPLNDRELMLDLMVHLDVPVILVASSRLGTINHSLLSLHALRARGVSVLGVIVSGESQPVSCAAIEQWGGYPILATLPVFSDITREALLQYPLGEHLESLCHS